MEGVGVAGSQLMFSKRQSSSAYRESLAGGCPREAMNSTSADWAKDSPGTSSAAYAVGISYGAPSRSTREPSGSQTRTYRGPNSSTRLCTAEKTKGTSRTRSGPSSWSLVSPWKIMPGRLVTPPWGRGTALRMTEEPVW